MLLGGFSVELLVEGMTLKEYSEPVDKRAMTTGVSYVLNQETGEKIESDQTFYAEVEDADKNYDILFGVGKELFTTEENQSVAVSFKAKIFVDGQWDHSWRSINKPAKVKKDGFIGEKRRKVPLMFDITKLEESESENEKVDDTQDNDKRTLRKRKDTKKEVTKSDDDDNLIDEKKIPEDQDKFGYGAISVYFFNAKDVEKNESANSIPLAALHLHYRSTKWLLERNILVEERSDDVFDETQVTKDADEMVQQDVQVKPVAKRKTTQSRKDKNKKEEVKTGETTTAMEIEEPIDSDCDISEWTGKLDLGPPQIEVVNQGAKKKSRGKKDKKTVDKVNNETESNVESGAKRYYLRARK